MKVTLLSYTPDALNLLIFAKSTRLNLTPDLMAQIAALTDEEKAIQLDYIANTIPSSWEFVDYVFLVEGVSRAYTHQQVRTRTASYAQQAMRIVDARDFEYIYTEKNKQNPAAMQKIDSALKTIKSAYKDLLDLGQAVEDARGLLPTNVATNIMVKLNLRAFSDLVKSRLGGRSQDEYRDVVKAMVSEVLKVHPWAEKFLFPQGKSYFEQIEDFAQNLGQNEKITLLKIVQKMRKDLSK